MATHRAIAGVGKSLVGVLADQCPKAEFPGATFKLRQAFDFQQSKRLRFGITLCLYRVSMDIARRNLPTRPTASVGSRQRPALSLELHFLLTAWATTAEQQHDLLGWAMCVLNDHPVLPAADLNRFAGGGEVFTPPDSIEIVPENLDAAQMKAACELIQIQQQPSVAYVVRSVAIQAPVA